MQLDWHQIIGLKMTTEIDKVTEKIKLVFDESEEIKKSFFDSYHPELMENSKYARYVHLCSEFIDLKKREHELLTENS